MALIDMKKINAAANSAPSVKVSAPAASTPTAARSPLLNLNKATPRPATTSPLVTALLNKTPTTARQTILNNAPAFALGTPQEISSGNILPIERAGLAALSQGVQSPAAGLLGAIETNVQFAANKLNGGKKVKVLNPFSMTASDIKDESDKNMRTAKEGVGNAGGLALDVIGTGANMLGKAALQYATGVPIAVQGGIETGGLNALSAKEQGKSTDQQMAYGLSSGIASGAIEAISGFGASKALESAALKGASKLLTKLPAGVASWLQKAGSSTVAKILGDAVGEAAEEFVEYDVDRVLQKITLNNEVPRDIREQAYQALIGGVTGAIFGGINVAGESIGKQVAPDTQTQTVTGENTPVSAQNTQGVDTVSPGTEEAATAAFAPAQIEEIAPSAEDTYNATVSEQESNIDSLRKELENETALFRNLFAEFRSTDIETRRPELLSEAQAQQKKIAQLEQKVQQAQESLGKYKEDYANRVEHADQVSEIVSSFDGRFISEDALSEIEKLIPSDPDISFLRKAFNKTKSLQEQANKLALQLQNADSLLESASIQTKLDDVNAKLEKAAAKLQAAQDKIGGKAPATTTTAQSQTPKSAPAISTTQKTSSVTAPKHNLLEYGMQEAKNTATLPEAENTVVMEGRKNSTSVKDAFENFYTRAVDTQAPIARYAKEAGDGTDILASNTRNAGGTVNYIFTDALVDQSGNKIGDSLQSVLSPVPADQQTDFWNYMVQRQNIDRAREGKSAVPNYTSEMSTQKVSEIEAVHPEWKATGDNIVNWIDSFNRTWGVGSGIINADLYQSLRDTYKSYFPLQREFDEIEQSIPRDVTKQFVDSSTPIKKATGSSRDINNPVENIMNMVNNTVKIARYNAVGQNILESVRANPEALSKYAEIIDADTAKASKTDNIVTVLENGEKVYLKINDLALLKSLKGLPKATVTIPVLSYPTQLFKSLITQKNPFFALFNVARDVPTSYIYGSEGNPLKFGAGLAGAVKDIATNSDNYQRYKAVGGGMANFFNPSNVETAAKTISPKAPSGNIFEQGIRSAKNAGGKVMGGIEAFNNMTESAPRLAEFNRVYEATGDVQKALDASNNVTVNFSRGGDITKAIDRNGVAYLNAGVQGLDKFVRSFSSPRKAIATVAKAGISIFLPDMILYLINRDDEDYKELSNYTKDNYYCIPIGNGEFVKIPKAREFGTLFGSLFERIARAASGEENAFKGFGTTLGTSFAPANPITNNLLTPATKDIWKNETYSGSAVVPQSMIQDNRSKHLQYDEKTSELSKAIAEYASKLGIEWSPKILDHLIDSYTGVIADFLLPATTKSSGVDDTIKSKFVVDPTYSNQAITDFYDNYDEIQTKSTDKNLTEGIPKEDLTDEEIIKGAMQKASENISALSKISLRANLGTLTKDDQKVMKEYGIDQTLTGDAMQKALREKRIEIAKEANALYKSGNVMESDLYRSDTISGKVNTYSTAAGISKETAYGVYKALDALEPKLGAKSVSTQQKADAVLSYSGISQTQKVKLVSTLLSDSSSQNLLGSVSGSDKLLALYRETGDLTLLSSYCSVPNSFSDNNKVYTLTPAEQKIYKEKYLEVFNRGVGSVFNSLLPKVQAVRLTDLKERAAKQAKRAVINSASTATTVATQTTKSSNQPYYGKGNIDLNNRPIIKNPDGSISTVYSMTFEDNGKFILVPGVRKGLNRQMTADEAWQWYQKTGEYLGKFDSEEEAEQYAISLHEDQEKQYS